MAYPLVYPDDPGVPIQQDNIGLVSSFCIRAKAHPRRRHITCARPRASAFNHSPPEGRTYRGAHHEASERGVLCHLRTWGRWHLCAIGWDTSQQRV